MAKERFLLTKTNTTPRTELHQFLRFALYIISLGVPNGRRLLIPFTCTNMEKHVLAVGDWLEHVALEVRPLVTVEALGQLVLANPSVEEGVRYGLSVLCCERLRLDGPSEVVGHQQDVLVMPFGRWYRPYDVNTYAFSRSSCKHGLKWGYGIGVWPFKRLTRLTRSAEGSHILWQVEPPIPLGRRV